MGFPEHQPIEIIEMLNKGCFEKYNFIIHNFKIHK